MNKKIFYDLYRSVEYEAVFSLDFQRSFPMYIRVITKTGRTNEISKIERDHGIVIKKYFEISESEYGLVISNRKGFIAIPFGEISEIYASDSALPMDDE
jgi:hypothetical protein